MVRDRLRILRKKLAVIANASAVSAQSLPQHLSRPSAHRTGGTPPMVANTPPR
jgi:hypothetical protein